MNTIRCAQTWEFAMAVSLNRVPLLKAAPALITKAIGYVALVIGAALLLKGLQLSSNLNPATEDSV
jgi:hypothetical protein